MQISEFEKLVHSHQDRVFGFAYHMLGRREDAQDVTQEVLIRLWRRGDEIDGESALPWLMRVTRNACIDRLRRARRIREIVSTDAEIEGIACDNDDAAEMLEHQDRQSALEAALAGLSEPYRSVVILREIQEMKYEEIGGAMDMPLNTVKVYIHRGRKMLREQLNRLSERERV